MTERSTTLLRALRPSRLLSAWLGAALALGAAGSAAARPKSLLVPLVDGDSPTAFIAQRGGGISLAQATAIAQRRYHGRVVRAEAVSRGDHVIYEIRILGDDGRVRTVRVDGQTGAIS